MSAETPAISNKRLVAVVDSSAAHRQKVCAALMSYYDLKPIGDAKEALASLSADPPALILLHATLEPMSAPEFIREALARDALKNTPIIYIAENEIDPQMDAVKEAGADGVVTKPYPRSVLTRSISAQLNTSIEKEWEALPDPQRGALQKSIAVFNTISDALATGETLAFESVKDNCQPLVEAIENNDFKAILDGVRNHDDYTYAHSMRVATLLSLLGHAAGFKNDDQLLLASGGLLHDVGKMMIPHNILNKPGKLTEEEFTVMKSHVPETVEYLKSAGDIPKGVFIIAEQHHEKIDGTGYPHNLQGTALNELARMAAVVDVFSALTDRRVYKPPMEAGKAMGIMTDEMTSHLDPHYVKLFRKVLMDADILS